jgi:hypothetical protein
MLMCRTSAVTIVIIASKMMGQPEEQTNKGHGEFGMDGESV